MGLRRLRTTSSNWRALATLAVAILTAALSVSGCFGGGGTGTSTGGVIKGYVTEIDANGFRTDATLLTSGPGVERASVSLVGTSKIATTNYRGEFTFSGVAPGTYSIVVTKPGWASAAFYGVGVETGVTTEVTLRMVKPGGMLPITESIAPNVSISCPSPVSGTGYVYVDARDETAMAGALLFIDGLLVSAIEANSPGDPVAQGTYLWETYSEYSESGWHDGEHVLTALALDASGNIGCRSITVTVNNGTLPGSVPYAPTNVTAQAMTIHYSLFDLLSAPYAYQSSSASPGLAARILEAAKKVRDSVPPAQTRGTPAGSDAVVACGVSWLLPSGSPSVTGFKVYRDGTFVAESPVESPGLVVDPIPPVALWLWLDGSPALCPGKTVSYSVSGYNRSGEGRRSAPDATTPLHPLSKVTLTAPAQDSSVSSLVPLLSWAKVAGADLYLIVVRDEASNQQMWEGYAAGAENAVYYGDFSHTPPGGQSALPLVRGRSYTWFVMAIASTPDPPIPPDSMWSPDAQSISTSDLGRFWVSYY